METITTSVNWDQFNALTEVQVPLWFAIIMLVLALKGLFR